jgi:LacI family transcriptional regulator
MKKQPTLDDIAKKLGLSKSTVSRALRGTGRVSEETRTKIKQLKDQLGYQPNALARGLTTRKTGIIGVVLEDILNSFFTEVAKGIETELRKSGYTMLLTSTHYSSEDEFEQVLKLCGLQVDGVLITPVSGDSEAVKYLKKNKTPFFLLNSKSNDKDVSWIDTDNEEGGYLAANYLLDLGYTSFMYVRAMFLQGGRDRFAGFCRALTERNINPEKQVILDTGYNREDGYNALSKFIEKNGLSKIPPVIITVNDYVALGVLECLVEQKIRVPEDISIMGFDDVYISSMIRVPLTTIHQPKFSMGEIAANMLIKRINGNAVQPSQQVLLKPSLKERESCKEYAT